MSSSGEGATKVWSDATRMRETSRIVWRCGRVLAFGLFTARGRREGEGTGQKWYGYWFEQLDLIMTNQKTCCIYDCCLLGTIQSMTYEAIRNKRRILALQKIDVWLKDYRPKNWSRMELATYPSKDCSEHLSSCTGTSAIVMAASSLDCMYRL